MKIVKINSLGCPSCIIMNKVFNKLKEKYSFEVEEFVFDFDDISRFNAGRILPVFIFYKDDTEIDRLCGEHKIEEFESIIKRIL